MPLREGKNNINIKDLFNKGDNNIIKINKGDIDILINMRYDSYDDDKIIVEATLEVDKNSNLDKF